MPDLPPGKPIYLTIHGDALTAAMRNAHARGDSEAMREMCFDLTEAERLAIGESRALLEGDSHAGFKVVWAS